MIESQHVDSGNAVIQAQLGNIRDIICNQDDMVTRREHRLAYQVGRIPLEHQFVFDEEFGSLDEEVKQTNLFKVAALLFAGYLDAKKGIDILDKNIKGSDG